MSAGGSDGYAQETSPRTAQRLYESIDGPSCRLNVSPLATVLQGGREIDSVQRLIHIAQNLSLQPPESPLQSPTAPSPKAAPTAATQAAEAGGPNTATSATVAQSPKGPSKLEKMQQQQADWKDRERGFLHRQLLHNLFFRHSCSNVTAAHDSLSTPSPRSPGTESAEMAKMLM